MLISCPNICTFFVVVSLSRFRFILYLLNAWRTSVNARVKIYTLFLFSHFYFLYLFFCFWSVGTGCRRFVRRSHVVVFYLRTVFVLYLLYKRLVFFLLRRKSPENNININWKKRSSACSRSLQLTFSPYSEIKEPNSFRWIHAEAPGTRFANFPMWHAQKYPQLGKVIRFSTV